MKNIPHRKTTEKAAKEANLGRLYTTTYGFVSMFAHGRAYGIRTGSDSSTELYASACVSLGMIQCINLIAEDWIVNRRLAPMSTINRILGI